MEERTNELLNKHTNAWTEKWKLNYCLIRITQAAGGLLRSLLSSSGRHQGLIIFTCSRGSKNSRPHLGPEKKNTRPPLNNNDNFKRNPSHHPSPSTNSNSTSQLSSKPELLTNMFLSIKMIFLVLWISIYYNLSCLSVTNCVRYRFWEPHLSSSFIRIRSDDQWHLTLTLSSEPDRWPVTLDQWPLTSDPWSWPLTLDPDLTFDPWLWPVTSEQ